MSDAARGASTWRGDVSPGAADPAWASPKSASPRGDEGRAGSSPAERAPGPPDARGAEGGAPHHVSSRAAATERDRGNPRIADVLLWDPTQPVAPEARVLAARDLTRWSHRALLPLARVASLVCVALIRAFKRVLPFQFSWHTAIDVLCVWFMRRFMSADAAELLARHFVVETNLLAFIARNCRPEEGAHGAAVPVPTLRPLTLAELGKDNAVIAHDLAVYNLVIDVGQAGASLEKREHLDFSMIHVPPLDGERARKRVLELDIETSLYLMNIPFCLFCTESEYERAVNSFQLDESVCAMLAGLTGDATFRTWTPVKFPSWISVRREVPKELFFHACVCEYAHTHLERIAARRDAERADA